MAYAYADTVAGAGCSANRSAESLSLDGHFLEDLISGFRVLYTRGREALSQDLESLSIHGRHGEILTGKRWPARTITVGYQLVAESPGEFRAVYNALAYYLEGTHKLIFADEADKFFKGEFAGIDRHDPGTCSVVGEMSFYCADPFKYSLMEYSAPTRLRTEGVIGADGVSRQLRTFKVTYNGTFPAHPRFHTDFYDPGNDVDETDGETDLPSGLGDCGYIAFLDQDGHVLQFGNPDEADGVSHKASQKLIDNSFVNKGSWSVNARKLWKANQATNSGTTAKVSAETLGSTETGAVGSAYSKQVTADDIAAETAGTLDGLRYLEPTSFGSGASSWHGPTISALIPKDTAQRATSGRGAADWKLYFRTKFGAGDAIQIGVLKVLITDSSGGVIAAAEIAKTTNSMQGTVTAQYGSKTKEKKVDLSYYNKHFGATNGKKTCTIIKSGASIKFNLGGVEFSFKTPSLASTQAVRVTFAWSIYGTEEPVSRCGVYNIRFTKDNCDTYTDQQNTFSSGDSLDVNTADASILLNGEDAPDLGALGNDWETLVLVPGEQHIIESRSKWCAAAYRPVSTMYWREVFL